MSFIKDLRSFHFYYCIRISKKISLLLNLNNVLPISAEHGENIEELLARCIKICHLNDVEERPKQQDEKDIMAQK